MAPKVLSADDQVRAQTALRRLEEQGLVPPQSGRGRGRGRGRALQPLAAALAYERGQFNTLSEDAGMTAAAFTYSVHRKTVVEYVEMLRKSGPGAQVQTMAAARSRLSDRMQSVGTHIADLTADGNCQYRGVTLGLQDLQLLSVTESYAAVRRDLANFLEEHALDSMSTDGIGAATTLADFALADTYEWKKPIDWPKGRAWPPQTLHEVRPSKPAVAHEPQLSRAFVHASRCWRVCAQIGFGAASCRSFSLRSATASASTSCLRMGPPATWRRYPSCRVGWTTRFGRRSRSALPSWGT